MTVLLERCHVSLQFGYKQGVQLSFEGCYFLFGSEYFCFVLFQLFRNIPFGTDECLLADPLGRYLVLVRVADFDILA